MNRKKRKLEVLEIEPPPPPKPPTKEELTAQKKKDHQLLNLLKIQIQPIMDYIQKKYKKFRTPVIPQSQIQYLYDELDPNFVRPDIPQFRPFELDHDKDGLPGLRETASGKFFYNLETTTIEERLSNGFYARPKDFVADIKSLAKDAKNIGDNERTLKANELLSNVEVDLANIEATPVFADNCEAVYQRQLKRAKEKEEKAKKKAAASGLGFESIVQSDIGAGHTSDTQISGPVKLGEIIPGSRLPLSMVTPYHNPDALSNGFSGDSGEHRNGNSVPSRLCDDVEMGGTDELQQISQPFQQMRGGPSNLSYGTTGPNTQMSQRSGFQEIPPGTSPTGLINDASTTTSGKKTSDGWSTQATNGISHPHSSPIDKPGLDSQLPDTQRNSQRESQQGDNSSDEQWPHSQAHGIARGSILPPHYPSQTPSSGSQPSENPAVPAFDAPPRVNPPSISRPTSMANILNDSPIESTSSQASSQKDLISDHKFSDDLLNLLVRDTSGCSIEQLEQINRELMETLWRMRGEYNRVKVAAALVAVSSETINDIEEMQKVLQPSQATQTSGTSESSQYPPYQMRS